MSEIAQGPYMAATVRFEGATSRMQSTEPTTKPPRPDPVLKPATYIHILPHFKYLLFFVQVIFLSHIIFNYFSLTTIFNSNLTLRVLMRVPIMIQITVITVI